MFTKNAKVKKFKDNILLRGMLEIVAINVKTKEEKLILNDRNLVVTAAKANMSRLIAGDTNPAGERYVSKMSWGTGTTPANPSDVALVTEIAAVGKKALDSYDFPDSTTVRFIAELTASEGNGYTISEAGLWTEEENLFARKVFSGVSKSASFIFIFRWSILFG